MESNSYFNAGVMVINVNKWIKNNTQSALVELMNSIYDKIDFGIRCDELFL